MNTIRTWYEFVLGQMAADSYLDDPSTLDDQAKPFDFKQDGDLRIRLRNGANHYDHIEQQERDGRPLSATRMTARMAQHFIDTWEVIDHLPNTTSGFSATVLKHRGDGTYTLSFRSTESKDAIDGGDVERDSFHGANGQIGSLGFAWAQLRDMENYYRRLQAGELAAGSAAEGAALASALAAGTINVTGYSLGSHLAQVFTLLHPDVVEHTYTFNGAGIGAIADLDPLTEYAPAILERIDILNSVMADPSVHVDRFDGDALATIARALSGGTYIDAVAGSPFAAAMLDYIAALRNALPATSAPERVYDDPYFELALAGLPNDTTGASAIGILESVNYTRERITPHEKITNLYGHSFSGERILDEVTAGAGQMFGSYLPIYIEDQPLLSADVDLLPPSLDAILRSFGPTHSIALLADSLAVMDLYAALDPSLVAPTPDAPQSMYLNRLFESMTSTRARLLNSPQAEGNTLEVALDSLGHLVFADAWQATGWSAAPGAYGDIGARDAFHQQIQRLRDALFEGEAITAAYAGLTIQPLAGFDASTLASRAARDPAYRYALRRLNPFVVSGNESIYEQHGAGGNDADGAAADGEFSTAYWFDRANFLLGLADANTHSRATAGGEAVSLSGKNVDYVDETVDAVLHVVTPSRIIVQRASNAVILHADPDDEVARVTFSDGAVITGSRSADRLYGGSGANVLFGLRGEDRLEAGAGDDTLYGNNAENDDDGAPDLLFGGRGADTYHVNYRDVIEDGDGSGTVVLGADVLSAAYRESADPPGTYTSRDGRYTYVHDVLARTLTVTAKTHGSSEVLTIANYSNGQLGIALYEHPLPGNSRFSGSAAADIITVNGAGTEISGTIDGRAIEPHAQFSPRIGTIDARGGDDVIAVPETIPGMRIYGDQLAGEAPDDGHDTIVLSVVPPVDQAGPVAADDGAYIFGGGGNDRIVGGQSDDRLSGGSGNDRIFAGAGNDRLSGGDPGKEIVDNDVLLGGAGQDELFGHGGDDALFGGEDADTLRGGAGNDVLHGDVITWAYQVADQAAWNGPSLIRGDDGIYTAAPGAGAMLTTPDGAGQHVVFEEAVDAEAGDDNLDGGAGDDHLLGGDGDDTLTGGADRDLLEGEAGDDALFGGSGNDILYGDISPVTYAAHSSPRGAGVAADGSWTLTFREFPHGAEVGGNDTLDGGAGTDTLFGGAGDDVLDGGRFDHAIDILYGGSGNDDYLFGFGDGRTFVHAGDGGADRIVFRAGVSPGDVHLAADSTGSNLIIALTLNGRDIGDELIISGWYRGNSIATFTFEDGHEWTAEDVQTATGRAIDEAPALDNGGVILAATDQADVSLGGAGNDEVYLLDGADLFAAGGGNDRVFGGDGDDELQGNDGNDLIAGESGNDRLYGEGGDDALYGGSGDDVLTGGNGSDTLVGGAGADDLLGGPGNDSYRYARGDGEDVILDTGGTADRIVFAQSIAATDLTIEASGNTLIFEVHANGTRAGDRLAIVDGLLETTRIEWLEFHDGTIWNGTDITGRLSDLHALEDGLSIAGGAQGTTYTLTEPLEDGFMIAITDAGGIDVVDIPGSSAVSGSLTPVVTAAGRSGDDLVFALTVESTIGSIADASGTVRINGFHGETGFIETIRVGGMLMNAENLAPRITMPLDDQFIPLGMPYSFTIPGTTFEDSPFDRLELGATRTDGSELPGWLVFDPASATLSGTPGAENAEIIDVAIVATDVGGLRVATGFELNVGNVNVAPALNVPVAAQAAMEGANFTLNLAADTFSDPNPGDPLTIAARLAGGAPLPAWLSFNPHTNAFSGTPAEADVGLSLIELTATDSGALESSMVFALTVDYRNDAPRLAIAPPDLAVTEQEGFSLTLPADTFIDDDGKHGDELSYTLTLADASPVPGWLLFDADTLTISGRAVGIFADQAFGLKLTATDDHGATASASFDLNVSDVRNATAWYVPHAPVEVGAAAYSRQRSVTTALHNGDYVVVWESDGRDGDAGGIYAQRYRGSGDAVGATVRVSATTSDEQHAPAVAALNGGGFVVSWVSLHEDDGEQVPPLHDGGGVYAQLFAADASPIGGETRVNHVWSGIQDQTAVAALSDGGFVIAWFSQFSEQRVNVVEYGVGEPGLFAQRYAASGAALGAAVRVADVGIGNLAPGIAGLLGGGYVMAWNAPDGDDSGIVAQRYFSDGAKNGPSIPVNAWTPGRQSEARLAALATGGFVVVWHSNEQDSRGGGIFGQRFTASGVPAGNEFRIDSSPSHTRGDPAIAAMPDGGFVVSWVSAPISGSGDLYMQRFSADGSKLDGETRVDAASLAHGAPSLTVLPDGDIVHTWTATDGDGVALGASDPWVPAGPVRIESSRIELRANTPVAALDSALGLDTTEFKSIVLPVRDKVFFDPDTLHGDTLEFSLKAGPGDELPSWLTFDAATATFNGIPLAGDTGSFDVGVVATDRAGTVAESSVRFNVGQGADITVTAAPTSYRVNAAEPRGNYRPAATRLADGSRLVVWDSGTGIYGQGYAADGSPRGLEFRLDSGAVSSTRPAVSGIDDGGFVAAWERTDQALVARTFDPSGAPRGDEFLVVTEVSGDGPGVRAVQMASGGFALAWRRQGPETSAIILLRSYSGGSEPLPAGDPIELVTDAVANADFSLQAFDTGEFMLAWTGINAAGGQAVFARRFSAAAAPLGEVIRVDDNAAFDHRNPALTVLADGGFVVTWNVDLRDGDEDVYARLFDAHGTPRGGAWRVNNVTDLPQRNPAVTAMGNGGFVIAWHSEPGVHPGEYGTVRAQYFDRAGNPVRDEIPVTLESHERLAKPVIVSGADGSFDIFWASDHEQDGPTTDAILARHFELGGPAYNAAPVVVAPIPDQDLYEDADYSFLVPPSAFFDPERENLDYRATLAGGAALPVWLRFDPRTLRLHGRPGNDDAGSYDIAVTATDPSGNSVADRFRVIVANVNDAPTAIDDIAGLRFDAGVRSITLDVLANDVDPDPGDTPASFTLDSAALLHGPGRVTIVDQRLHYHAGTDFLIPAGDGLAEAIVTYTMSDSSGASAVGTATIGLHNGDVELLGGGIARVSSASTLYGYGTFVLGPGASGSRVTFAGRGAAGASGGDGFGTASANTVQIAPGSGTTSIGRLVGAGLPGSGTVEFIGLNHGDVRLGIGSLRLTFAGSDVALHIDDFEPDDVFGGTPVIDTFVFDGIAYRYEELLRQGFDIDGSPGTDSLTGTNIVDRINGFDGDDTISGGDGDDVLSGGTGDDVLDGGAGNDTYIFRPGDGHDVITDPGGDDRVVFAAGLSAAAALSERRGDDLFLALAPGDSISVRNWFASRDHRVEAFVFTDDDLRIVEWATVDSIDQNHSPVVSIPIPAQHAGAGTEFSYRIPDATFADVDRGDTLTLSASRSDGTPLPQWLNFDADQRRLHGEPPAGANGNVSIRITATDRAGLSATNDFVVTLASPQANTAPSLAHPIPDHVVVAGDVWRYTLGNDTFIDPDPGDYLGLSARLVGGASLPAWLAFDPANRMFSSTALPVTGDFAIEVVAEDGSGLRVSDSFTLSVAPAVKTIRGFQRADILDGTAGPDRILGRGGDDVLDGKGGDDEIFGGAGKDTITDHAGNNTIHGDANDDLITTGAGNDIINGGSHADTIHAGDGNNTVRGDNGSDAITTGAGKDWVDGGSGDDIINAGAGDDIVFGGRGADTIAALLGNNLIDGGNQADAITTGPGDDTIFGGNHDDDIDAGAGSDALHGGNGNDRLLGGAGADRIEGGSGADFILGGAGNDTLIGDAGGDTYFFNRHDGVDVVVETNANRGDTLAFGADVTARQVWFSASGDDLRIDLAGTPDTVFVRDWFTRPGTIEQFEIADGTYLVDAAVGQLVDAMAAFDPPTGIETVLPEHVAQTVDPVIAAVWQAVA